MDVSSIVEELHTEGRAVIPRTVPVRTQRHMTRAVQQQIPAVESWMGDMRSGIAAYGVRTPGTETVLWVPPAPSPMGSVTPSR